MKTIDYRKETVYKASPQPAVIDVPEMLFVTVDGKGAPENNPQWQDAMAIIYGIVYTIKFWDKKHTPPEGFSKFSLCPLEGLWWMKNGKFFDAQKPEEWHWTVMLRLPEFVTPGFFKEIVHELVEKKKSNIYKKARLEKIKEGECVQLMHIGPYSEEEADINKLHDFATQTGYSLIGEHHELYFGDPRRTAPEKLKTIIRQPVLKEGVRL